MAQIDPNSIVDYLGSKGMASDPNSRAKLYESQGLGKATDYLFKYQSTQAGTATNAPENTALLNSLRNKPVLITDSSNSITQYNNALADHGKEMAGLNTAAGLDASGNPIVTPTGAKTETPTPPAPGDTGYTDQYTQMLDRIGKSSDAATRALIGNIQATKVNRENQMNDQYDRYKRGLEVLGLQEGTSKYLPDIQAGKMHAAEAEHNAKLQQLDATYLKTLADANAAKDRGDIALFKQHMDYVKELKAQKATEVKALHDATLFEYDKTIKAGQAAASIAPYLLGHLNNLAEADHMPFLKGVSENHNIPVESLISAIGDEKSKSEKSALDAKRVQSLIDKADVAAKEPKITAAEKKDNGYAMINQILTKKDSVGRPYTDNNGFLIPEQLNKLISAAAEDGVSRKEFLTEYGYLIYKDDEDALAKYHLTEPDKKILGI
jgi:hypothetical protein